MSGELVLVIDDDVGLRDSICTVLTDEGYRAAGAGNGAEALAWLALARELPTVIVLDLMMPTMDGWAFRAEQRRDPRLASICTIVLTANTATQRTAIDVPHFFAKPITLERLVEAVEECCSAGGS